MTCKFLEISSGQDLPPKKFEIVEVEKNNFLLKTKDSHVGLLETLQKWLQSNNSLEESSYSNILCKRSSSMIKEAYKAENLFIGGNGSLMHWSVSQKRVTKDYNGMMFGSIYSMVQTNDNNYLFLSDVKGS